MKTGPLSKAEKFYIDSCYEETTKKDDKGAVSVVSTNIPEMAKELERSVDAVRKYVEDNQNDTVVTDTGSTVQIKPEDRRAYKLFARKKGATVMTEGASGYIDSNRKSVNESAGEKKPDTSGFIHKIRK